MSSFDNYASKINYLNLIIKNDVDLLTPIALAQFMKERERLAFNAGKKEAYLAYLRGLEEGKILGKITCENEKAGFQSSN